MATTLTWLGHNCWLLEAEGSRLLVDPFLDQSPTAPRSASEIDADFVLVSHGHFDHIADAAAIAKRTGATVLANYEVGEWIKGQGVPADRVIGMNPGGGVDQPFGRLTMTRADHSSSFPDGSYAGVACGMLVEAGGKRIHFACDTALYSDMRLIGEKAARAGGLDCAVVPIGDLFTMGPEDAVAAVRLLGSRLALPCHYNTFPAIAQDGAAWAEAARKATGAEAAAPEPGETITL